MGKRVIIRFVNNAAGERLADIELPSVDHIGINQVGIFVAQKDEKQIGFFPAGVVAGIFYPEEPSPIVEAKSLLG